MTVDLDDLEALCRRANIDFTTVNCYNVRDKGEAQAELSIAVPGLIAHIRQLEQSNATKTTRIAVLVAEVGTLKARVAELERERPCCVHPVARHAYNGCADCSCNVRWPHHPDAPDDWSAKRVDRLNVATERAAGDPDYQPAWTRSARPEAK